MPSDIGEKCGRCQLQGFCITDAHCENSILRRTLAADIPGALFPKGIRTIMLASKPAASLLLRLCMAPNLKTNFGLAAVSDSRSFQRTTMSASKPAANFPFRLCMPASFAGRSAHQAAVLSSGMPRCSIPVTTAGRLYCKPTGGQAPTQRMVANNPFQNAAQDGIIGSRVAVLFVECFWSSSAVSPCFSAFT